MKILLLSYSPWPSATRMPRELGNAGFEVHVLATSFSLITYSHDIHSTTELRDPFNHEGLLPVIQQEIERLRPRLILPVDEISVELLERLFVLLRETSQDSYSFRCLQRSLFIEARIGEIRSKQAIRDISESCGIRVPAHRICETAEEVIEAVKHDPELSSDGHTIVLKADMETGGTAVRICRSEQQIRMAFDHVTWYVREYNIPNRHVVAERYINGQEVLHPLACLDGAVLADFSLDVLERHPREIGPSSVVRIASYPEIDRICQRFCRKMNFTGFCSFDMIVEAHSGLAYLVDFNPRQVSMLHLGSLAKRNLYQSFYNALAGLPMPTSVTKPFTDTIALFPQELVRDPQSPYLKGYHDVPWEEPHLVESLAKSQHIPVPTRT